MATVLFFHSVYGLRPVEFAAAERMRAAGHQVVTPDLYGGQAAETIAEGFALRDAVGWDAIRDRALAAAATLADTAVLAGHSMGVGVAAEVWARRPDAAGLLFLHGLCPVSAAARPGLPIQVHLADPDAFEPADEVAAWRSGAAAAGVSSEVFLYPGVGHLFTDATLPDFDAAAAEAAWGRALQFLAPL